MNIASGVLNRLAHVVLVCVLAPIALRADAAMADAAGNMLTASTDSNGT